MIVWTWVGDFLLVDLFDYCFCCFDWLFIWFVCCRCFGLFVVCMLVVWAAGRLRFWACSWRFYLLSRVLLG